MDLGVGASDAVRSLTTFRHCTCNASSTPKYPVLNSHRVFELIRIKGRSSHNGRRCSRPNPAKPPGPRGVQRVRQYLASPRGNHAPQLSLGGLNRICRASRERGPWARKLYPRPLASSCVEWRQVFDWGTLLGRDSGRDARSWRVRAKPRVTEANQRGPHRWAGQIVAGLADL
jgi:hypothetical protein